MRTVLSVPSFLILAAFCGTAAAETEDTTTVAPIEVVGTTPLDAGGARIDRLPAAASVLRVEDLARAGPASTLRALDERLGGVDTEEGASLILELIEIFRVGTPALLAAMHDHATQGNWPQVAMAAHSLKSSAAYLGAWRLSQLCQRLEELCAATPVLASDVQPLVLAALEAEEQVLAALDALGHKLLAA